MRPAAGGGGGGGGGGVLQWAVGGATGERDGAARRQRHVQLQRGRRRGRRGLDEARLDGRRDAAVLQHGAVGRRRDAHQRRRNAWRRRLHHADVTGACR